MDDLYCPVCRLVLERRRCEDTSAPRNCPRCLARAQEPVTMLPLDMRPPEAEQQAPAHSGR
jgi:hypothetical protein